jgi:hypothetical protein
VGTASTGAAIALTGQIFNIQEHWPAAILLWAISALAAWALLHDEAQQTLALLLIPAWMIAEFTYYAENHIGQGAYIGRFLFVWAVLYLTILLGSRRKAVQGILAAAGAIAAVLGVVMMVEGWRSWGSMTSLPWGLRVWAWMAIAALPLIVALGRFTKSFIPVAAAAAFAIALPWCNRVWTQHYTYGPGTGQTSSYTSPTLRPMRWLLHSPSSSSGGVCVRPARPSSTSVSSASPLWWCGFTSAIFLTRSAVRSDSSAWAFSSLWVAGPSSACAGG